MTTCLYVFGEFVMRLQTLFQQNIVNVSFREIVRLIARNPSTFGLFMESWILQVSCKVNAKPFSLHLLCKRPEVFMIPQTDWKSN